MHLKFFVFLGVFAACLVAITADTPVMGVSFDSYVGILQTLTSFASQLRILQAVWGQIRADYPQDFNKISTLYEQFDTLNASQANVTTQQQQAAYELQAQIRYNLVKQGAEAIAEILSGPSYPIDQELSYACLNVSGGVTQDIYALATAQLYDFKTPQQLAAVLSYLGQQCGPAFYETVLQTQQYLYWKFIGSGVVNEAYLLQAPYYIWNSQRNSSYEQLSTATQANLEHTISNLPSSLQYLYFEPSFCLLNAQYWEYLYTTSSFTWAQGIYPVFTWGVNSTLAPEGVWASGIFGQLNASSPALELNFTLEAQPGNNSISLTPQVQNYTNIISANSDTPIQEWSLQLIGNRLVFNQNGLLMCAISQFYNQYRRFVYGYNDAEHTVKTPACQWIAGKCPWQ